MNSVYRLQSDELTPAFIQILKATYPHKEIEISVAEVLDETDYLLSSPANAQHLETALENYENNRNHIEVPLESIKP